MTGSGGLFTPDRRFQPLSLLRSSTVFCRRSLASSCICSFKFSGCVLALQAAVCDELRSQVKKAIGDARKFESWPLRCKRCPLEIKGV